MSESVVIGALAGVLALVLALPMSVKWVEEELEAFLVVMGIAAVTISGSWSKELVGHSLAEPIRISLAVLLAGFAFRSTRNGLRLAVDRLVGTFGLPVFLFGLVLVLGLASSLMTAIIAALVLVEVVSTLRLERGLELRVVVLSCYSIGMGAVLTPIGEPLSTIATARLAGPPHSADFYFLMRLLWPWLGGGMLLVAALAFRLGRGATANRRGLAQDQPDSVWATALRAGKVYVFVAALVLLGEGMSPLVDRWIIDLPVPALYWANIISAALDNATLAAAELSPAMSVEKIRSIMLALILSGGMLVPGNIPNIIAAQKLGIGARDWARYAAPLGAALMAGCFVLLQLF